MFINLDAMTDEQLAVQYQATGCQDAFTTLYKRYQRLIESISRNQARAAGIDANEFISALNETFWRCVVRFDPARGEFSHYVNVAFRFAICKVYRDERNRRADDIDNCLGIGAEDDALSRAEFKADIEAAVKGDQWLAEIVRQFMAGYSREEIARSFGTYRMCITRKLQRLREAMA